MMFHQEHPSDQMSDGKDKGLWDSIRASGGRPGSGVCKSNLCCLVVEKALSKSLSRILASGSVSLSLALPSQIGITARDGKFGGRGCLSKRLIASNSGSPYSLNNSPTENWFRSNGNWRSTFP